jgi:ethanolamine utilization protein EutP (predicted NTPase)
MSFLERGGAMGKVGRELAALSDETIHLLEEAVLHQLQLEARVVAVVDKSELAADEDVCRLRRVLRGR